MKILYMSMSLLLFISAFGATMTSQDKADYKKSFSGEIIDLYGEGKPFLPKDIVEHLVTSSESLYLNGYANKIALEKIQCKTQELLKIHELIISTSRPQNKECIFSTFSSTVCEKNPQISNYIKTNSLGVSNQNCTNDGPAMNGLIPKRIETSFGVKVVTKRFDIWSDIYTKYINFVISQMNNYPQTIKAEKENATVSECKPNLIRGYDQRVLTGPLCKKTAEVCSGHLDCCTGRCDKDSPTMEQGVCSEAITCYKSIGLNNKCGKMSSDGYTNNNCQSGACIQIDYNSSDLGALKKDGDSCSSNVQCRSDLCIAQKCVEQSKCLECSSSGEQVTGSKTCCPGLIKSLTNRCVPDFPPLLLPTVKVEKNILKTLFDNIFPSAYAQSSSCSNGAGKLKDSDVAIYAQKIASCMNVPEETSRELCLSQASDWKINKAKETLLASGCEWDREKYLEQYNSFELTSKTYSNPKECRFNSYNDTWRDMSNIQRNAELVVRAFEYMYTGSGTEDFWVNSSSKNIYTRAKVVAKRLRKVRSEFIDKMKDTDRKMACQCIAIFGPSNFSEEQQNVFNSDVCSLERSAMGTMNIGNVDGSSQSENEVTASEGAISEIDAGASGISHERILVEWLRTKYENQMDRFTMNAEIEADINELSTFLNEQSWEKALEEPNTLYSFTVYKARGFWRFIQQVVSWSSYVVTRVFAGKDYANKLFAGIFGGSEYNNGFSSGRIDDNPTSGWAARGRLFRKYRDYRRDFVMAHYKNFDSKFKGENLPGLDPNLKCDVRGVSSSCFKNVHETKFEDETRYLIDIKNPLFVDYGTLDLKHNYVELLKVTFDRLYERLKSTKPGGKRHVRYLSMNPLHQKDITKMMLPQNGSWKPRKFTDGLKTKLTEGVKKYAACKKLSDCGVTDQDYEGDYGFGELFESEQDIKDFSEYAYQHHFHWPSLSASSAMGYPLMAQRAYFEIIAFNIKLVGSLAAGQGRGYGDAYFKYAADWDARRGLYDSAGVVKLGDATKNVKYSKEFLSTFKTLDFSVGAGIKAFDAKTANLAAGSGLNSFEESALAAGRSKASKAFEQKKKRDNYLEQTKSDPRALAKQSAQSNLLNSLGSPLNSSSLNVGGKDLGNTGSLFGSGGSLNNVNKVLAKAEKTKYKSSYPKSQPQSSPRPQAEPSFNMGSLGSEGEAASTDKNIEASGMSQEDIDRMLNATKKNSSLKSDDDDGLFTAVSKAYKRNYDFFFERKSISRPKLEEKSEDLNDSKKDSLKKLLGN